jgi:hypothetical protein
MEIVTWSLKPFNAVTPTVTEVDSPWVTEAVEGCTESEKSGDGGGEGAEPDPPPHPELTTRIFTKSTANDVRGLEIATGWWFSMAPSGGKVCYDFSRASII